MKKISVIAKVDELTDWVNPIVVINRPNEDIRICLDPMHFNKAIRRQFCKLTNFEELTVDLSGARVFSTLDANKGFYQIKLDE